MTNKMKEINFFYFSWELRVMGSFFSSGILKGLLRDFPGKMIKVYKVL
jgi:hypothetical protein